jgi:integrase
MSIAATTSLILRPSIQPPIVISPVGRAPETKTIDVLCRHFMRFKALMLDAGELGQIVFDRYSKTCDRLRSFFGAAIPVSDITPVNFLEYRAALPKTWGVACIGMETQLVRTIFKHGYEAGLYDRPVRFGPGFKNPSRRLYRRQRREKGIMMFEADEIRRMLDAARPVIRAMILLGINCGFGNSDCGRLPFSAVNLDKGWVNFPRPKTEVDRRSPLWPETIAAIRRAILLRPEPHDAAAAECIFITTRGRKRWANGEAHPAICTCMTRLTRRLGIRRKGLGFYSLRRTFETIGSESLDQVAVDHIMGHVPHSSDMAAIYRQRIADERLVAVTDHVRQWLFPDDVKNHFLQFRQKALAIHTGWEKLPKLTAGDVQRALTLTGIKQVELARGIGFNAVWVSAIICGRAALSSDGEMRVRAFFEQLSQGRSSTPAPKKELPHFEKLSDVPLTDEAVAALSHFPMVASDLATIGRCLAEHGVTQTRLAEWWGYKRQAYGKFRYGQKPIPLAGADRLRELFGMPRLMPPDWRNRKIVFDHEPGNLPITPSIAAMFEREHFGHTELQAVVKYLRQELKIQLQQISKWVGRCPRMFGLYVRGEYELEKSQIDFRSALRSLFATPAPVEGGAE